MTLESYLVVKCLYLNGFEPATTRFEAKLLTTELGTSGVQFCCTSSQIKNGPFIPTPALPELMGRQFSGPLNRMEEREQAGCQVYSRIALTAGQLPLAIPILRPIMELVGSPSLTRLQKPLQSESFKQT